MKRGQQPLIAGIQFHYRHRLDLDEKRTATILLDKTLSHPFSLDLDEKRTATSNLLEKGLIQKLRIEWAKNTFSFLVKVLSFAKRKKV